MSFTIFQNEKTSFQAIKTRSLNSRKIDIFPKGLTHGFGLKMAIFSNVFFQEVQARKMSFTIFQKKELFSRLQKQEVQKVEKRTFFQRVSNVFVQKQSFFHLFFQSIQATKMSFKIFYKGKTPFQAPETRSLKSQKLTFLQRGNPWFWSKNDHFSNFFFQAVSGRKMSLTIFQKEETPFQAIKTKSSKRRKIDIFPKGLTHSFGAKMTICPNLFCQAIQGRKISFTIFQNEKTPLQGIKTRGFKSRKIDIFQKGITYGFGPKVAIFPTLFFRQYTPE